MYKYKIHVFIQHRLSVVIQYTLFLESIISMLIYSVYQEFLS